MCIVWDNNNNNNNNNTQNEMNKIHKFFFCEVNYISMMGLASKKNQLNKMMALQSIYFGDRILFTLNNKRIRWKIWIVIQFINLEIIGKEDKNKKKFIPFFNKIKYKNFRTMHRAQSRIACKLKIRKYFLVSLKLNNKIDNKNKLFFYFFFGSEVLF